MGRVLTVLAKSLKAVCYIAVLTPPSSLIVGGGILLSMWLRLEPPGPPVEFPEGFPEMRVPDWSYFSTSSRVASGKSRDHIYPDIAAGRESYLSSVNETYEIQTWIGEWYQHASVDWGDAYLQLGEYTARGVVIEEGQRGNPGSGPPPNEVKYRTSDGVVTERHYSADSMAGMSLVRSPVWLFRFRFPPELAARTDQELILRYESTEDGKEKVLQYALKTRALSQSDYKIWQDYTAWWYASNAWNGRNVYLAFGISIIVLGVGLLVLFWWWLGKKLREFSQ